MKKQTVKILSLFTLAVAAMLTATGFCVQKTVAQADAELPSQEQLLVPVSYEQYLSLNAPMDVAATDNHVAIADGTNIFLFDRSKQLWQTYTNSSVITKLQFGSRDELYFLDGNTNEVCLLQVTDPTIATKTGIVCSTFSIRGDVLYYINNSAGMTSIYSAPLTDCLNKTTHYSGRMYSPSLSFWTGEIYYVYGTEYLHKLHPATGVSTKVADLPEGVISMTISEGTLLCTTEHGEFFAYALSDLASSGNANACTPITKLSNGYSAVSANDNDVYLVRENSIQKYSLEEKALTSYEISAQSDSLHRLDSASEVYLADDKLFIADDNNDRISIYNTATNTFETPIVSDMDTPFISSYGETLLTANAEQAILYSLTEKTYGQVLTSIPAEKVSGNIVGIATVYGSYYIVTDTNYCYTLSEGEEGYTCTETLRKAHYAEALTSDVNGFLYILNDETVYRYTEKSFLAPTEEGVKLCEIPASTKKLAVDYSGNLYALVGNDMRIYKVQEDGQYAHSATATLDNRFVYEASNTPLSFAFGIEENATYILYEGDYVTVSSAFQLPTVRTIPSEGIAEEIASEYTANFSIVQTLPNSLLVQVDIHSASGAEYLPYLGYYRSKTPITALKIGETSDYALLSYRENASSAYKTVLVAKACQTELEDDYAISYETPKTGYLTNAANGYKYPCMDLTQVGSFAKNEKVVLLGEITKTDCEYFAVAYGEKTVYIPKSHVNLFDGTPPTELTVTVGNTEKDNDAVWRLGYLVLGCAAICVLVDVLILRKKDD